MSALDGAARAAAVLFAFVVISLTTSATSHAQSCLPAVLKQQLSAVQQKFGKVSVISSHRPGARIAGTRKASYHASCRAVDFHPPRGKYAQVAAYLKANHSGGVGTYSCGAHHIHIDNGPRVRFHTCAGGRGKSKRYASKRRGRAA